jgi:DNA-binding transcriptional LysR family regulator
VELRDVQTFLVLAEELHFGRTAKRLHMTQGRVSQIIRSLECEVGEKLFERTSRQVRLTTLGRQFHTGARIAYNRLAETLQECRTVARSDRGELRLGYVATIGSNFAASIAVAFEAHQPRCAITLNCINVFSPHLAASLDDDMDVMLVWSPGGDGDAVHSSDVKVGPVLAEASSGLLVPDNHPLAAYPEISLEDLADYELLWPPETGAAPGGCDLWTPRVTPSGRPLRRASQDLVTMTGRREVTVEDVITLVARRRGLHCTVVSLLENFPFPGLRIVPISDMPPMVVVPVWSTANDNPAARAFAEFASVFRRSDAGLAIEVAAGCEA